MDKQNIHSRISGGLRLNSRSLLNFANKGSLLVFSILWSHLPPSLSREHQPREMRSAGGRSRYSGAEGSEAGGEAKEGIPHQGNCMCVWRMQSDLGEGLQVAQGRKTFRVILLTPSPQMVHRLQRAEIWPNNAGFSRKIHAGMSKSTLPMLTGKAQAEEQITHPEPQKKPNKPKVDPPGGALSRSGCYS